jgi:hypothetical protein
LISSLANLAFAGFAWGIAQGDVVGATASFTSVLAFFIAGGFVSAVATLPNHHTSLPY